MSICPIITQHKLKVFHRFHRLLSLTGFKYNIPYLIIYSGACLCWVVMVCCVLPLRSQLHSNTSLELRPGTEPGWRWVIALRAVRVTIPPSSCRTPRPRARRVSSRGPLTRGQRIARRDAARTRRAPKHTDTGDSGYTTSETREIVCVCVSIRGQQGGGWWRVSQHGKTMRQSLDRASLMRSPASAPPTATPTSHHHNHCDQILKSKFHTVSKKNWSTLSQTQKYQFWSKHHVCTVTTWPLSRHVTPSITRYTEDTRVCICVFIWSLIGFI